MRALVVAETVANVEELGFPAPHNAIVQVSEPVSSTNRHVVKRTLEAVGVGLAASIVTLGDSLASNNTVVGIGHAVGAANWLEEIGGTLAALVNVAGTSFFDRDLFAVEAAKVVIGLSVFAAHRVEGDSVAHAAAAVLAQHRAVARQTAEVVELLASGAANRSDNVRAVVALVVVWRANTFKGLSKSLAFQQALVVIGDAVAAANGRVFIGAVLALGVIDEARSVFLESRALALKDALIMIGLVVGAANGGVVT